MTGDSIEQAIAAVEQAHQRLLEERKRLSADSGRNGLRLAELTREYERLKAAYDQFASGNEARTSER